MRSWFNPPLDSEELDENSRSRRWMRSRHAKSILGFISFAESICAPIITDPFLAAIILVDRAQWKLYTLITIVTSVLGGIVAYALGALFFEFFGVWLIDFFQLDGLFEYSTERLIEAGFFFVFVGALTPIPYKLVALASGFVLLPLWIFIAASILGRGLRFIVSGYLTYAFGPMTLRLFRHQFNLIFVFLMGIMIAYIIFKLW